MGVSLGSLALALAATSLGVPPEESKPEITYQFRSVEVRGLGWRDAGIGLKPVAQHNAVSVWTCPDDFLDHLPADARAVADSGAFAIVLECVPAELAATITAEIPIPTIGIGAGAACDGQVLVLHDMLGLLDDFRPRFARRYAELGDVIRNAAARYVKDVESGDFPTEGESFR